MASCSRGERGRAHACEPPRDDSCVAATGIPARRRRCRRRLRIALVDDVRRSHAQRLEAMDPGRARDARFALPARRHRRRHVSQLREQHVGKSEPGSHAGGIGPAGDPLNREGASSCLPGPA